MHKIILQEYYGGKIFNNYFSVVLPYDNINHREESTVEVYYKYILLGVAEIKAVRKIFAGDIRDVLSFLDCGKPAYRMAAEIYKHAGKQDPALPLDHLVLQYKERNMPNQEEYLQDWWKGIQLLNPQS